MSEVVSWNWLWATHGLPCSGTGVRTEGVLAGNHRCATESRVTLWQSANPCCVLVGVVGVVTSCVPCPRVRGRTTRSCATENTYTPARLEALCKLSVVAILSPSCHFHQFFCGWWVLSPTCHLVRHVLHLVEISSKCSCLLSAVSQSNLFTYMQICLFLCRLINFECCRVCPWTSL